MYPLIIQFNILLLWFQDFIRKCLNEDPSKRPKARELLFHPVLFEVHSLKLLAAHTLVKNPGSIIYIFLNLIIFCRLFGYVSAHKVIAAHSRPEGFASLE